MTPGPIQGEEGYENLTLCLQKQTPTVEMWLPKIKKLRELELLAA